MVGTNIASGEENKGLGIAQSFVQESLSEFSLDFFLMLYLFLRETECEREKGKERGRHNLKQAAGSKLIAQSPTQVWDSRTMRS